MGPSIKYVRMEWQLKPMLRMGRSFKNQCVSYTVRISLVNNVLRGPFLDYLCILCFSNRNLAVDSEKIRPQG